MFMKYRFQKVQRHIKSLGGYFFAPEQRLGHICFKVAYWYLADWKDSLFALLKYLTGQLWNNLIITMYCFKKSNYWSHERQNILKDGRVGKIESKNYVADLSLQSFIFFSYFSPSFILRNYWKLVCRLQKKYSLNLWKHVRSIMSWGFLTVS